ncbi:TonB-dependent receptor [Kordiimonas sp. SCSIO 12603]|uniref:TonB-dependent receptor n=1 Tax=Kordiimonas sp. SCSIO 12603 TaxID=2829596 RepID=UPI0021039035|nr:TonB-dependent receptor [Kordiimonas sp. SCSIO 12603]UTW58807.1 TonB-dependent receptor [Kordiimonas sp. SCSIO 12603]
MFKIKGRNFSASKKQLLSGICLSTLAMSPQPLYAQDQDDTATSDSGLVIENIVISARKRQESLQEVPLSVQAITGDKLENERIDNVENLIGRVPNLSLSSNLLSPGNDFLNIVIRGVGSQSAGAPAVGTFVDGAFVPALSFDIGFLDVERIEVLRGPQSTLFGRNTQGGALNIVLKRPDEETTGKVAFTVDEFETVRAQGAISGQISENWFGSAAIDVSRTDGYLENPVLANQNGANGNGRSVSANDGSKFSGRGALRYKPNSRLDVNLAVDGSYRKGLDGHPGVPRGTEEFIVRSDFQIDAEYENYGGALNIDYGFENVDLTLISAYRHVSSELPFDFDGSPERGPNFQDLQSSQEIISQEIRLSGTFDDQVNWIIGGYAFSENSETRRRIQFQDLIFGSLLVDAQDQKLDRKGFALFADAVWEITDRLELQAGVRYADESVDSEITLDFTAPLIGLAVDEVGTGTVSDSNFSPAASLRYNISDDLSAYVRYARGFRAGGFPAAPATAVTNFSFQSETSDNYEFGLKGKLADGLVNFDLSLFQIDITDQQVTTLVFINNDPNLPVASVDNAGRSRSRGFEANITARPTSNFEFGVSAGYVNAEFREYIDTVGADRSGEKLPFVPEWTLQAYGTYTIPLGTWGELDLSAKYRYVDDILSGSGVDIDLQFPVESYDVIDLSAAIVADDWRFELFVDNVTNDFIETRVFNAFFFEEPRPFSVVLPPRKAGFRVSYQF